MPRGDGKSAKCRSRSLLFVCTGNTCRSPMAEVLFRKYIADNFSSGPLSEITISSAGLHASIGAPASAHARTVAAEQGTDLAGHRSRPMTDNMAYGATWIVAMSVTHADELRERFPFAADKIRCLGEFLGNGSRAGVSDPFGGSLADYRRCAADISSAFPSLAFCLRRE